MVGPGKLLNTRTPYIFLPVHISICQNDAKGQSSEDSDTVIDT